MEGLSEQIWSTWNFCNGTLVRRSGIVKNSGDDGFHEKRRATEVEIDVLWQKSDRYIISRSNYITEMKNQFFLFYLFIYLIYLFIFVFILFIY